MKRARTRKRDFERAHRAQTFRLRDVALAIGSSRRVRRRRSRAGGRGTSNGQANLRNRRGGNMKQTACRGWFMLSERRCSSRSGSAPRPARPERRSRSTPSSPSPLRLPYTGRVCDNRSASSRSRSTTPVGSRAARSSSSYSTIRRTRRSPSSSWNSVVGRGVQLFMGGSLSAMCKASIPIVADKGPLMMCLSPAVYPPKGGYVFSSSIHPVDLAISSFRFFHKKGWNDIALMMGTDATGQEVDTKIDQVMAMPEFRGMHVVAHEHFGTTDVSVAAQISKIVAAHPQALLIWTGTGISVVFQALSDAGSKSRSRRAADSCSTARWSNGAASYLPSCTSQRRSGRRIRTSTTPP